MVGGEIFGIIAICLLGEIQPMEATECLTGFGNNSNCYMKDSLYSPRDDISGQGRTEEASAEACQARCLAVSGCTYFSFHISSGGCHLSSSAAKIANDKGTTAGLKSCSDLESFSASLSSEHSSSYPAQNCLDGNEDTFCHTEDEENPYFVIEYNEPIRIFDVKVTVRKHDCCFGRAKEMVTIVTNTKPTEGKLALDSGSQLGSTFKGPATKSGQVITFSSVRGITGKYVIVQQQYKGVMNLAEVQVNREYDMQAYLKKIKTVYSHCIENPECEGCEKVVNIYLPNLLQKNIIKEGQIGMNNGSLVKRKMTHQRNNDWPTTLALRKGEGVITKRTNASVTINGTVSGIVGKRNYREAKWRSTGLYAGPGDLLTLTLPEELVGKVLITIGHHHDFFYALKFPCDKTTFCKIGSPYGGLIGLNLLTTSYQGTFTLNITNAISAPYFIFGKTTNQQWKEMRQYSPKWAVLRVPGQVQIFVQTLYIKDIEDMNATMARIKLTMDDLEDMLGLPPGSKPGEERLQIDPGLAGGYHSGGCNGGMRNAVGDKLYYEDKVAKDGYDDFFKQFGTNGLILHEFGHGFCSKDLPNEGAHWFVETVSSYIRYKRGAIQEVQEVRDMTSKDLDFPLLFRMVGFSRYSRGKPCGQGTGEFLYKHKHWSWYAICWKWIHWIPSRIHGWNVWKDVHNLDQKITKNYNSKSDRLVDLYCKATKHNMIPLFNLYNIKPSEQAITDNCQKLPESEILSQWLNIVKCVNQSMDHVDKDIRDCVKMPKFPQHKGLCLLNGVCRNTDGKEITLKQGKETFDLFGSAESGLLEYKIKRIQNKDNCFERAKYVFLDCKNTMNNPVTATFYEKKKDNEFNYKKTGSYTYQGYCLVRVGNSGSPTKTVPVNDGCDCPALVNRTNWLGTFHQDEFSVTRVGSSLEIKRIDQNGGWGQDFSFECKGNKPNAIAYMSSLYNNDYRAKKCMDGNVNTFCHTQNEENPYFVIEYMEPITVTDVKVTVRKNYWERAKKMVVIVANTRPTQGQLASGSQLGETFIGPADYSAQVITFKSKTGITGKYVIVQQQYKGVINFAEVQVNNGTGPFASTRSSSTYDNNLQKYGPHQSVDGVSFFHSKQENYPWLELKLWEPTQVSDVTIINRKDCCGERLKDAVIRTGMNKVPDGTKNQLLTTNQVCGTYAGPAATGETINIVCTKPIMALYITIQLNNNNGILQIKQVGINYFRFP